jgi:hypothetical protein
MHGHTLGISITKIHGTATWTLFEEGFMSRKTLFLMFMIIMISGCSKGNHHRKPTSDESFMKGQWAPLHKPS